ncbi:MAG TPA: acetoacetate decarboxylase family protein [Janthinobacterium sp.]|nr:acetoacetate decarboxylase family protein [Janthinobacterium sp.]
MVSCCDGTPRSRELNQYRRRHADQGAWSGPGALQLFAHALAPLARFPVLEVIFVRFCTLF